MKKTILKMLFALLFVTVIMSCSKDDPFDTNVSPYDLRDPGLYSEQIGEVKWIFSLEPGETKYLEIDGHMYKVHFKEIYREDIWTDDTYWTNNYYINLHLNSDSVLIPFKYNERNMSATPIEKRITSLSNLVRKVFNSADPIKEFEFYCGKTFRINNSLLVCNPGIFTVTLGTEDGGGVDLNFIGYFIILKK